MYDPDQGFPIRPEGKVINLGEALGRAIAKIEAGEVSPHSLSNLPAVQPSEFNLDTDHDIPNRVWSNWIPAQGSREIKRALSERELVLLKARKHELANGLRPYLPTEGDEANSILAALLGGYRSMRHEGDDVEAVVTVLRYVLRDFPLWAISEGCRRIVMNEAGLDPRWPPNDAQIHAVVKAVITPYREKLKAVSELLVARIEPPPIVDDGPRETWEETKADLAKRGFNFSEANRRKVETPEMVMAKLGISQAQWDAIPNLPPDFEERATRGR